jgi:hypothetical protein
MWCDAVRSISGFYKVLDTIVAVLKVYIMTQRNVLYFHSPTAEETKAIAKHYCSGQLPHRL